MALMAAAGEITPMPVAAIFADTQDEPDSVYGWLDWLEQQLPFPVHRVTSGHLSAEVLKMRVTKDGRRYTRTNIPFWTKNGDGSLGRITHRSCTKDYKIIPIRRLARQLAKIRRGQKFVGVVQWIGISLDEVTRMKPSREPWQENRWPLIELRMRRDDCLRWMERHGFPKPPRSACLFCPFHSDREWRRLRDEEPEAFQKAVEFELAVQKGKAKSANFSSQPFLHRSCVPLSQLDLRTMEERGQINLFENECEGMCGV
jgi:hypothetical protein